MARTSLIPGFRFHPTDVELVMFYLKRKLLGKKITVNAIAEVNIYDFSPWDLPDKSSLKSGDLEWYFFCPKAKKYSSGSRSNRSTETGFWKATGKDRNVKYNERTVATIKTLVFHLGHAGKGQRTDWVMHEYKMEDAHLTSAGIVQDTYVLCKVFEKSGSGPKNGAHYGKPFNEEEWDDDLASCVGSQVVGGSNKADGAQKGPATTSMTETGSSIVTFSANQPSNTLNNKQKDLAAMRVAEPGSSTVTFSADPPTDEQKGPAADVMFFEDIDLPAADDVTFFEDIDMPVDDDVMLFSDFDLIMGVEDEAAANVEKVNSTEPNEDDAIYKELVTLIDLEDLNENDFKTDGAAAYPLDNLLAIDDLDVELGEFYAD